MESICQTNTQLSLADEAARLGANLGLQKRLQLQGVMASSVAVLRKLREKKCYRDWLNSHRKERKAINDRHNALHRDEILARRRANRKPSTPEQRAYHRKWEQENKDRTQAYHVRKYAKNKERLKIKRSSPEYRAKMKGYLKRYRKENAQKIKALMKSWRKSNPEYFKNHIKFRKENDPQFSIACTIRAATRLAFRSRGIKKNGTSEKYLGCTWAELKVHIESQFAPGMSWAKRNSYVVDHYVPVSAFNLLDEEEKFWAFNWQNLRPITWTENSIKSDTIPNPLPSWLPPHIATRILTRQK